MSTGKLRAAGLAISLVLASSCLAACGSGSESSTVVQPPPIAPDVAAHLAKLSDRIASDLDSGDTCHAAYAADDLRAAVEDASMPASMQADVGAATGRLVDEVNCPPPPPQPEPKKPKEDKHGEHGDEHGGEQGFVPPGHAKHGGLVPPGHAKLGGEAE
jgi:hypothetical protein